MHKDLPKSVCEECVKNIKRLYNFRKVIRNAHLELRERLMGLKNSKQTTQNACIEELQNQFKKIEIDMEYNEINEYKTSDLENAKKAVQNTDVEQVKSEFTTIKVEEDDREHKAEMNQSEMLDNPTVNTPGKQSSAPIGIATDCKFKKQDKIYKCKKCHFTCTGELAYRRHKTSVHYDRGMCNVCGKTMRRENLSKHVRNHSHSHVCSECGENFKNYHNLRKHINKYHKQVELYCKICGKIFYQNGDLNCHFKKHCKYSLYW